jgi:photoactive yellow protein
MGSSVLPTFELPGLLCHLTGLDAQGLDALDFGVIGFGKEADARVTHYNAAESRGTGVLPELVMGRALFTSVAQCMNNFLVAQRFDDAVEQGVPLDAIVDFTLTWRMKPTPVRMRLLSDPGSATQFIAIHRTA